MQFLDLRVFGSNFACIIDTALLALIAFYFHARVRGRTAPHQHRLESSVRRAPNAAKRICRLGAAFFLWIPLPSYRSFEKPFPTFRRYCGVHHRVKGFVLEGKDYLRPRS